MRGFLLVINFCVPMLLSLVADAHNKVVVIFLDGNGAALLAEDDAPPLRSVAHLINVSLEGNGDYTNLASAMASITTATFSNPYLILVAEGDYYLSNSLLIKDYVSIRGVGREKTKIYGSITNSGLPSSALLRAGDETTISELTVENDTTGGTRATGIYSSGVMSQILNVDVVVRNANTNYGIYNTGSVVELTNVSVTMDSVPLKLSYGLYDVSTTSNYHQLNINTTGPLESYALYAGSGSILDIVDSSLTANGTNDALHIEGTAGGEVVNTQISGSKTTTATTRCFHIYTPLNIPLSC